MSHQTSVTHWLEALRSDSPSDAQEKLWSRYFDQLVAVARRKLGATPRRANDEEDAALSAMDTFFRGAVAGRYPQLKDRGDLWSLLVTITARKALNQARNSRAKKRGGGQLRGESIWQAVGDVNDRRGIEQILGDEPTPEFAVQVAEQCDQLMARLDEQAQAVARLKLEGCATQEIAQRLGCSPRTVERRLDAIRRCWSDQEPAR